MLNDKQRELISFKFNREGLFSSGSKADAGLDAIIKPSDGKILGVLDNNQYIIPHIEFIDRVETALKKMNIGAEVTEFKLLNNGARMFAHYRPEGFGKDVSTGKDEVDTIYPELIVRNGYDAKTTPGIEWGLFRTVCTNGARVVIQGERMTKRVSMGDTDIDVIMSRVQTFGEKTVHQVWARIQDMFLNSNPQLPIKTRAWFAEMASNKLLEAFDIALEQKQKAQAGHDLNEWQVYNVVTAMITHQVGSYMRRRNMDMLAARHFRMSGELR